MSGNDYLGIAVAVLMAATFGSIMLYLLSLFRLGRRVQLAHPEKWKLSKSSRWPVESPLQPAFRFLLAHWDDADWTSLDPGVVANLVECRRMLVIGVALLATWAISFAVL